MLNPCGSCSPSIDWLIDWLIETFDRLIDWSIMTQLVALLNWMPKYSVFFFQTHEFVRRISFKLGLDVLSTVFCDCFAGTTDENGQINFNRRGVSLPRFGPGQRLVMEFTGLEKYLASNNFVCSRLGQKPMDSFRVKLKGRFRLEADLKWDAPIPHAAMIPFEYVFIYPVGTEFRAAGYGRGFVVAGPMDENLSHDHLYPLSDSGGQYGLSAASFWGHSCWTGIWVRSGDGQAVLLVLPRQNNSTHFNSIKKLHKSCATQYKTHTVSMNRQNFIVTLHYKWKFFFSSPNCYEVCSSNPRFVLSSRYASRCRVSWTTTFSLSVCGIKRGMANAVKENPWRRSARTFRWCKNGSIKVVEWMSRGQCSTGTVSCSSMF